LFNLVMEFQMSHVGDLRPAILAAFFATAVSFVGAAPAAAVPIDYVISGDGSFNTQLLGNSGGSFVFTFDGGDTSTLLPASGGVLFANNPLSATVTLTNGGGTFYSGALSSGSSLQLSQAAGLITLFNLVPFAETFGFSDPSLITATLADIGFSVTIVPSSTAILSALPLFLPVQNGSGSDSLTIQSVSNLTFSEVAGVSTTPLPAALPLFATGLGAMALFGWRRKRKNAATLAA
jgi:hypothetical protein